MGVRRPHPGTAYIECAQACGLALLGGPPTVETALAAHSRGVGQLIAAALAAGATRIVVGLGGSACTDGGRGMVEALGGLCTARTRLAGVELIAATDVEHPLLGPMGAARVFGPQKGADPDTVAVLEQRLDRVGRRTRRRRGPRRQRSRRARAPRAASAQGCWRWVARRESGAAVIAEHTRSGRRRGRRRPGHHRRRPVRRPVTARQGRQRAGREAEARGTPVLVLAGQVTLDDSALRAAGIAAAYADLRARRVGAAGHRRRGQPAQGVGGTVTADATAGIAG